MNLATEIYEKLVVNIDFLLQSNLELSGNNADNIVGKANKLSFWWTLQDHLRCLSTPSGQDVKICVGIPHDRLALSNILYFIANIL
jgi:hypothetical protein